jgi:hypothetical protein
MGIFDHPLIPVAGVVCAEKSITFYMHETFDRLPFEVEPVAQGLLDILPDGFLTLVHGNLSNPLFQWPVYAMKRKVPHASRQAKHI